MRASALLDLNRCVAALEASREACRCAPGDAGAIAQFSGHDQHAENGIRNGHRVGVVKQTGGIDHAATPGDSCPRRFNAQTNFLLEDPCVRAGGRGQVLRKAEKRVVGCDDLGAWTRISLRRDQDQANQAGKLATTKVVDAGHPGVRHGRHADHWLQACCNQHNVQQLGAERCGGATNFG